MTTVIVIGGQWGDEGKGKIVDYLAHLFRPDFGVRFNGGPNAGHSIDNELGQFVLHQVPSTILTPGGLAVLGNGVVIDPGALLTEVQELQAKGVDPDRVRISDRAHLILPEHKQRDQSEERLRGEKKIGTTGRGIGPTYADKAARTGVRVADLLLGPLEAGDFSLQSWEELLWFGETVRDRVVSSERLLAEARMSAKSLLLEGAQGVLLDVDFGTYPRVTSSSTTRAGAYSGSGLTPDSSEVILGVFKSYVTRVGEGVFPTELPIEEANQLRELGAEYGATTGRPRRIGWFDAVLGRYAQQINQFSHLVLTKCDVLDQMPEIKICTAYRFRGDQIDYPPATEAGLLQCEPVYQTLPGWRTPTDQVRKVADLPREFRSYCNLIEELVGAPIGLISVGKRREETIEVNKLAL